MTPTQSLTPSPTPTWRDVPLAKGRSAARVLVSDPDQHTTEWVQKDFGPYGFAVSGDLIVMPNEVRGDITVYRNGRPILHKSTGDAYVYDVAIHDGLLYVLDGEYADSYHTVLRVYSILDGGGKLKLVRTRDLDLGDNSSEMELYFVGDNLIASSSEGKAVVAVGSGPLPAGGTYDLQKETASVQPSDGTPALRFHGYDILSLDVVATGSRWVWYLVEDWSGKDFVYRVPRSGAGPVAAYRLRQSGDGGAFRDVVVDRGRVYELLLTTNSAAAQVLLIGQAR